MARKTKGFWGHEYTVTKLNANLNRIEVAIVYGSRDAILKQKEIEDQGYFAVIHNNTTKEEEYRTPGCEE